MLINQESSKPSHSRNGVPFSELSRGAVRSFSCSAAVALCPRLVQLLAPDRNLLDLYRDVVAAHARELLAAVEQRSDTQ